MFRRTHEEAKGISKLSFKRPFTSNYLANVRVIRAERFARNIPVKATTIFEKLPYNQMSVTTKNTQFFRSSDNSTPNEFHNGKSVLFSTNTLTRPLDSSGLENQLSAPYKNTDFLMLFKSTLTKHEASEIIDYPMVYYWGQFSESKIPNVFYGFDDNKGNYLGLTNDHIAYRYQIVKILGKGTFGQVFECFDHKENTKCAIKVIKSHKRFNSQAHTEIKILKLLLANDKENSNSVLHIKDYFLFRNHICITSELLGNNLYQAMASPFSYQKIKQIAVQVLRGLKYLKRLSVIHCDLKPENILFTSEDCSPVKIIDFGSSCLTNERFFTYIQSRHYRAPEVLLGLTYDCSVDMWSFGCILVELLTKKPLFQADSEVELLEKIVKVRGKVPEDLWQNASKKNIFFEKVLGNCEIQAICEPLKDDLEFGDFIEKCLEWDPAKRITPEEALAHPWLRKNLIRTGDGKINPIRVMKRKNLIINCL